MFLTKKSVYIVGVIAIIGACSPPPPEPIAPETIYNKYGDATGCRAEDGTITDVAGSNSQGRRQNPCEPTECEDGYNSSEERCYPPQRQEDGGEPGGGQRGGGGTTDTTRQ